MADAVEDPLFDKMQDKSEIKKEFQVLIDNITAIQQKI
jgi:hypothetical protein